MNWILILLLSAAIIMILILAFLIGEKLGRLMKRKNSENEWKRSDDESQYWRHNYRNQAEVEETEYSGKVVSKFGQIIAPKKIFESGLLFGTKIKLNWVDSFV